jgi:glycosyltransferase involved in cell wall biosynthesis
VKKFGIYLCYPPSVDLRSEGLGRHLGEFLKGAYERDDVEFVVACPSWLTENLKQLLESCGLAPDAIELIAPSAPPLLLTALKNYELRRKRKPAVARRAGLGARLRHFFLRGEIGIERRVASARTITGGAYWAVVLFLFLLAAALTRNVLSWPRSLRWLAGRLARKSFGRMVRLRNRLRLRTQPDTGGPRETLSARLLRTMEENEASLLGRLIEARKDVAAWYSPTAFWPTFHEIAVPRLMCVPDVVLNDFPTGFSVIGGSAVEKSFDKLESAIEHGEYFVTYSERVKWETLVRRYGADPESVFVIRHGANRLDDLVRVTGFPDNAAATNRLCRRLLATALQKDVHRAYEGVRVSTGIRFIFYASQFRPNKNIISLLRAYDYLLRRRFVGHKLILTGIPIEHDEVSTFIAEKNLQQDVLCLHNLNEQELAACYHLAELAVNPSLSEGGCPFTFTEAMSVGTPVVMARIPVTEEVITDPHLQAAMLFDPFDWRDMAARIEYGLLNRDKLRVLEQPFYEQLARRSWRNVVDDYVAILGRISKRKEVLHA